jgi:hypothetical protein
MNPYRLNHFHNVARAMNNYVAVSAFNYNRNLYHRSIPDQGNYLIMYGKPSLMNSGLSGLLAYGLHTIGMPTTIINYGYRLGRFFDVYA